MIDIIFFAIIAAVIISRLFKALGDEKYDNDSNTSNIHILDVGGNEEFTNSKKEMLQAIDLTTSLEAELNDGQRKILDQIRAYDISFSAEKFLEGAKSAFEMIVVAFTKHDKKTLQSLIDADVYKDFEFEIERAANNNQRHDTTLVSIDSCTILNIEKENNKAFITVKIKSEQITVVRAFDTNEIISGDPSKIKMVEDVWTFAKDIKSYSKMWTLVSTDAVT